MAGDSARGPIKSWDAHNLSASAGGQPHGEDARILTSAGEIAVQHSFSRDGMYLLRVRAYGQQAGTEPVRMAVLIDGKPLESFDVAVTEKHPRRTRSGKGLPAATAACRWRFSTTFTVPTRPIPRNATATWSSKDRGRGAALCDGRSPAGEPSQDHLSHPQPTRRMRKTVPRRYLRKFATRAYRRPVTGGEVARLLRFVDLARENGDGFERGIQLAVQAVLVSPQFLFRVELNRGRRRGGKAARPPGSVPLNDFELASRLSYFLWSSMPDDELFQLAARESCTLPRQRWTKQVSADARATPRPRRWSRTSPASGSSFATSRRSTPTRHAFPPSTSRCARRCSRRPELFFASVMHERPQHPRLPRLRLHVRERAAGPALRHPGRRRARSSAASSSTGRPARGPDHAGQHPDGDLEPDADLAGEAGQVGAGADPGHAAAAAAAGRARA